MADADGDKQKNGAVANALATEHKSTIESTAGATIFDIDIILCMTRFASHSILLLFVSGQCGNKRKTFFVFLKFVVLLTVD